MTPQKPFVDRWLVNTVVQGVRAQRAEAPVPPKPGDAELPAVNDNKDGGRCVNFTGNKCGSRRAERSIVWEKAAPPCDRSSRGRPPGRRICLCGGGVGGGGVVRG